MTYKPIDALEQLRTVFEAITPPSNQVLHEVYVDEVDYSIASLDAFTIIMIERAIDIDEDWIKQTIGGRGYHEWTARVSFLLCHHDVSDTRQTSRLKPVSAAWGDAAGQVLAGAGNLNGRVILIGDGGSPALTMSREAGATNHWWGERFHGPVFLVPIRQHWVPNES